MSSLQLVKINTSIYNFLGSSNKENIINLNPQNLNSAEFLRKNLNDQLTIITTTLPENILIMIDQLLQFESCEKIPITINFEKNSNIQLVQADITSLNVEAIVNPANSVGLGCFTIGHRCLDNVIHENAGPRLRIACKKLLKNHEIATGDAILTSGYNLVFAKYVLHTVGPINNLPKQELEFDKLASCYTSCLELCRLNKIKSIAFCCISTGIFGYPKKESANTAITTVMNWLKSSKYDLKVVFCTFEQQDYDIYTELFQIKNKKK